MCGPIHMKSCMCVFMYLCMCVHVIHSYVTWHGYHLSAFWWLLMANGTEFFLFSFWKWESPYLSNWFAIRIKEIISARSLEQCLHTVFIHCLNFQNSLHLYASLNSNNRINFSKRWFRKQWGTNTEVSKAHLSRKAWMSTDSYHHILYTRTGWVQTRKEWVRTARPHLEWLFSG